MAIMRVHERVARAKTEGNTDVVPVNCTYQSEAMYATVPQHPKGQVFASDAALSGPHSANDFLKWGYVINMRSSSTEHPTDEAVASRADGRPPEEAESEDPEEQARVILEDSENRVHEREELSL